MPLIALTGGIASGKSTISARLAAHGAIIVDADRIVRDVQKPGSLVLERIAETFGAAVIGESGELNRAALASQVFGNPDALAKLNAIVHPAVRAESARQFAAAYEANPQAVIVYDVPLLLEARSEDPWDLIVVAHAPAAVREDRLVELRGLTRSDAQARIKAQASDEQRLAIADVVIDTAGSMEQTYTQTDAVWERISG